MYLPAAALHASGLTFQLLSTSTPPLISLASPYHLAMPGGPACSPLQAVPIEPEVRDTPISILVVGECGDGKSTLVNALRIPTEVEAPTGTSSRGVTKAIKAYNAAPIHGRAVVLYDSPGVGDLDISASELLSLIENQLSSATHHMHGVIVTTPVSDGRIKLGAQVVQVLVEKGFVGERKWDSVILVGTKLDHSEDGDLEYFEREVVPNFFMQNGGTGKYAMTGRDDYSAVVRAIGELPSAVIKYDPPDPLEMSAVIGTKLGIDSSVFAADLKASRDEMARVVERMDPESQLATNATQTRAVQDADDRAPPSAAATTSPAAASAAVSSAAAAAVPVVTATNDLNQSLLRDGVRARETDGETTCCRKLLFSSLVAFIIAATMQGWACSASPLCLCSSTPKMYCWADGACCESGFQCNPCI